MTQTTKIRISITRETPTSMHERAINFYREISENEAIEKLRAMFLDIAEDVQDGRD